MEENRKMPQVFDSERIRKIEERLGKGDTALAVLGRTVKDTHETVTSINKRLFIDNGSKCVQTRIDRMETLGKAIIWLTGVLAVATVSLIGRLIFEVITK